MKLILVFILIMTGSIPMAFSKVYDYEVGNKLTLLEDPNLAIDHKIELIKKAKHHIHIITFFWDDTTVPKRLAKEINLASERGVEIRILSTYTATLALDIFGKGKKSLQKKSNAVFSFLTLNPGTHFSLTHSLHEKIFLVDGEIAILGGRNVSDSSLSGKDLEVQIEGPVVGQVQDHFKRMFDFVTQLKLNSNFKSKKNKLIRNEKLLNAKFSKSNKNYFPDLEIFNENTSARILTHEAVIHHYENKMNMKERQIQSDDILDTIIKFDFKKLRAYNYFLIFTDRYRNFLEENLANSKSIEMISNGRESAKFTMDWGYLSSIPDALDLVKKGLELYQWERNQKLNYVHEKVLIFDEDHVIIGSHNFAAGSTGVSNEIVIDFKSSEIAGRLIEVFEDEKNNSTKTKKADIESLERENVLYADTIELSRKKLIHSFILELF